MAEPKKPVAEQMAAMTTDETPTPSDGNKGSSSHSNNSNEDEEVPIFPRPKYVVTIVSPRLIHLEDSDVSLDEWKDFEQTKNKDDDTSDNRTVLNLHVLLVSLLNRLLRAQLFPRRAVHSYITPASGGDHDWVVFSILTPATVLPILLSKCEHFGVGNLVGLVYAVPLETCVLPLLNQTTKDEDEELLEIPSQWTTNATTMAPKPVALTKAKSSSSLDNNIVDNNNKTADATDTNNAAAFVIMAPEKKETPEPSAVRACASETFEEDEKELEDLNEESASHPAIRRSNSHPDILETSRLETSNNNQEDDKSTESEKRATPILEMIPEAKVPAVNDNNDEEKDGPKGSERDGAAKSVLIQKVLEARKEWLATASRIRVEQVAEEVTTAANLTWDYLLFVVCAAAISATGLAVGSSVTVLASMLVSPIMGPILAVTFGTMIQRPAMIQKALRNEAISLFLCILVGAFGGLVVWWTKLYESSDFPSNEMLARGEVIDLGAGVLIALPSGMATALSTLGKNSSGLVGVAISLSLLPPAVNAGICWMIAFLESVGLLDKESDDDTNYWRVGSISFGLTLTNIVCIWLAGVFTFWLKEVAPIQQKSAFWARDLKIARQKPKEPGTGKIKAGLQAAADLKLKYDADMGQKDKEPQNFRALRTHRPSSTSKWDDALLFDRGDMIPGQRIQRSSSEGILEQTEAMGGIDSASQVLFNNHLFENDEPPSRNSLNMSYHPDVPPEDVFDEMLWQRRR